MASTWAGTRERIHALRMAPGAKGVFGASGSHGHYFALLRPLSAAELVNCEQDLGVTLPADYREFLLEVSAGGAGPHYGLTPFPPRTTDRASLELLKGPFQPDSVQPLIDALEHEEPLPAAYPDEDAFDSVHRAWIRRIDELGDLLLAGTLELSHQGCGYFDVLVLTGPERGSVWEDNLAADQGVTPHGTGEQRVSFTDWYLAWLARAERQAGMTA